MIPAKCFGQIVIFAKAGMQTVRARRRVVEAKASWIPARAALSRNDDQAEPTRLINDAGCPPAKLPSSVLCPGAPTGQ
jgi:hypothetical protein